MGVLAATHMFYNEHTKQENRVLECFKKALKIGSTSINTNPKLVYVYIQILNKYFYFMDHIAVRN